mgnify:CR=1 FL=1
MSRLSVLLVLVVCAEARLGAQVLSSAKPIPRVTVEPLPHFEARFAVDEQERLCYHFHPLDRRPFLFPLVGPSGRTLTRMGHPHDPVSHSHHNSVWVSHHSVGGVNFWGDAGPNLGRIVPQRIEQYEDGDDAAWLLAVNHWVEEKSQAVLMVERRRIEHRPLPDGESLILLDLEFAPRGQTVVFDKTPFGLVGVRMRKSIGVHDGGGRVRNSEGGVNEKGAEGAPGVHWQPARWCDYSGRVTTEAVEGLALFDHPANPNHPTVFHVRDDGWMGAALTFAAPRTIELGAKLRLRYGLYVHGGLPSREALDRRWREFAALPLPATMEKIKHPNP